jgi:acyl dehydratase
MIQFPVEAAHVMMFERAVGDVQSEAGVAPPTFAIASDHFDPNYERRTRPGVPWFGSGRAAVSVRGGSQQATGGGSGFHAEERFVYHRPVRVGDVLLGETRDGDSWTKEGRRGGTLRFFEHVTEFTDGDGTPVVTLTWVDVLTAKAVDSEESSGGGASLPSESDGIDRSPRTVALAGGELSMGESVETVVVDDLKRSQIVMYAGASGDFHPMHTDGPYAEAMGMSGVFAHGMLTMGVTGVALTQRTGRDALRSYAARFRGIVWPGDTLTTRLTFEGVRDGNAVLAVATRNQRGELVLTGEATVSL